MSRRELRQTFSATNLHIFPGSTILDKSSDNVSSMVMTQSINLIEII
jgi:hypothetical protein